MDDWNEFLAHIRTAYRVGTPVLNDPEVSHLEWEHAVEILLVMVLTGAPEAKKAARLVKFVQDHPEIGWWYA